MSLCPKCGAETSDEADYCSSCGARLPPSLEKASNINDNGRRCFYCSKPFTGEDTYYFHCRYCDQDFCSEHRLPENHLCKSNPIRRNIPSTSTSMPYYSTGAGYYTSSGATRGSSRRLGGFSIGISKQGRNLAILIVAGLVMGFIFSLIPVGPNNLTDYLIQYNLLVYSGWYLPLLTSMIVVYPSIQGVVDVFFNALAVVWLDRLFASTYSAKQYYFVFLLTGLAGNLLSLLNGPGIASFGASGGIFGLVAGAVTCDYAITRKLNPTLVIWFVFIFIYSSFMGGVDMLAHLGGAVVGLAAGYAIGHLRRRKHGNTMFY